MRRLVCWTAFFIAAISVTPRAQAAFHLWNLNEVYTNSSGSLQFIELSDTTGGDNAVGGQQIKVTNLASTLSNTFNLPAGSLSGSTLGHRLLLATAGVQAAGGPAPDYIIPNDFLFTDGGSISFFGANSGSYSALPTDGTASRIWGGTSNNAINSPTDYAGQTGVVSVPEPATVGLLAIGGLYAFFMLSRRRIAQV